MMDDVGQSYHGYPYGVILFAVELNVIFSEDRKSLIMSIHEALDS